MQSDRGKEIRIMYGFPVRSLTYCWSSAVVMLALSELLLVFGHLRAH
jgi:hypothetical protein